MEEKKDTKSKIINIATIMFSTYGYNRVSIRNIAKSVGIKESSIYYYFKSKRDILDTILCEFENRAGRLIKILFTNIEDYTPADEVSFDWVHTYYCNSYLFDPFCNSVMRLMMMEQLHDEDIEKKYITWMFEKPYQIQKSVLQELGVSEFGPMFHAMVTKLSFQYLFTGKLTDKKKLQFTYGLNETMKIFIKR